MFEKATRLKLRFATPHGTASVEDLWDLSLPTLDRVAVNLHKAMKDTDVTFIKPPEPANAELQLKFDIVKHILDVRVKERDDAKAARDRATKKQQLLEVLERKQNAELESKSAEELRAMIDSL